MRSNVKYYGAFFKKIIVLLKNIVCDLYKIGILVLQRTLVILKFNIIFV